MTDAAILGPLRKATSHNRTEEIEDKGHNLSRLPAIAERRLQCLKTALAFSIENDGFHIQHGVLGL